MNPNTKSAIFIDVANALRVDFRELLARVRTTGEVVEARAFGDFRQRHLDPVALELYALGVRIIHRPSWPNGINAAGYRSRKRSGDRLLEKELRDLAHDRPEIERYVIVTADADIIPTINALRASGKSVKVIHPDDSTNVGFVLRMCAGDLEPVPMLSAEEARSTPSGEGGDSGCEGEGEEQ